MSINFDKLIKKQQEELEKENARNFRANRRKVFYWKPKKGNNLCRLMPPWTDEGHNAGIFYREVFSHWSVGRGGGYDKENGLRFTCPVKTPDGPGGTCPVCDHVSELRQGNPAEQEMAKKIYAKRRFFSNVVDLKDPVYTSRDFAEWEENAEEGAEAPFEVGDTKIQVWTYGQTIFKQLMDYFCDGIDLSSFEEGYDIKVIKTGEGINTSYTVRAVMKPSVFEGVGELEDLQFNLDELSPFPKNEDMERTLAGENIFEKKELTAANVPSLASMDVESSSVDVPLTTGEVDDLLEAELRGLAD